MALCNLFLIKHLFLGIVLTILCLFGTAIIIYYKGNVSLNLKKSQNFKFQLVLQLSEY